MAGEIRVTGIEEDGITAITGDGAITIMEDIGADAAAETIVVVEPVLVVLAVTEDDKFVQDNHRDDILCCSW